MKKNPSEMWRFPENESSLLESHRAGLFPSKIGISRTTLVGRFERKESDIFEITFSMRFCLSSNVLKGGLIYMFFPLRSRLKIMFGPKHLIFLIF